MDDKIKAVKEAVSAAVHEAKTYEDLDALVLALSADIARIELAREIASKFIK